METRSNKILVSSVVGILLAALVAFSLWKTANERSSGRPYDLVGAQSVSGLLEGSAVTFSGVPVGRVDSVQLDPTRPGGVKVRIDITDDNLQITKGTAAKLSGDLVFGTALISLEQASGSTLPLLARAGEAVPRIPFKSGGISELARDPSDMLESMENATNRLLDMTSTDPERTLTRLQEIERSTARMAAKAPSLGSRITPARQAFSNGAAAAQAAARQADLIRRDIEERRRTAISTEKLRSSLANARETTATLNQRLQAARAPVQGLSETASATSQKVRDVREAVAPVNEQVRKVESGGVGTLISGPPTPDYKPQKNR